MIHRVVAAAHRHAKPVCVCGELAADPTAVPVLVGLGVDELSLTPAAIPAVKAVIRALDFRSAVVLADTLLATDTAPDARRRAEAFLKERAGPEIEKL
jgi:phosphocarrier protein FPr